MMNLTVSTLIQLTSAISLAKNYLVCGKLIIYLIGTLLTQFARMTCLKIARQRKTHQWI